MTHRGDGFFFSDLASTCVRMQIHFLPFFRNTDKKHYLFHWKSKAGKDKLSLFSRYGNYNGGSECLGWYGLCTKVCVYIGGINNLKFPRLWRLQAIKDNFCEKKIVTFLKYTKCWISAKKTDHRYINRDLLIKYTNYKKYIYFKWNKAMIQCFKGQQHDELNISRP